MTWKPILFLGFWMVVLMVSALAYTRDYANEKCIDDFNRPANNTVGTSTSSTCDTYNSKGWGEYENVATLYQINSSNYLATIGANSGAYLEYNTSFRGNLNSSEYRINIAGGKDWQQDGFNNGIAEFDEAGTICYVLNGAATGGVFQIKDTVGVITSVSYDFTPLNISFIFNPNGSKDGVAIISLLNSTNYTRNIDNVCNNITTIRLFPRINNNGLVNPLTIKNLTFVNGSSGADTTQPQFNFSLNSTALSQNDKINMSGNLSDNAGLSSCQFVVNQSGSKDYYNKSVTGTSDKCSQNLTITAATGSTINFTLIVNDTSNNKAQSTITLGVSDVVAPRLINCTLQFTSLTNAVGNTNNFTCNATDTQSNIQSISFDINGTLTGTRTFTFTPSPSIYSSYLIFQSAETLSTGSYSISNVTVKDAAGNTNINTSFTFAWDVTQAPVSSPAGNTGGGGGGGGGGNIINVQEVIVLGNLTLQLKPPLIKSNFIYHPFRNIAETYSTTLTANKVLDKCISRVFDCIIRDNSTIIVSYNYSDDASLISKVQDNITLIDKAQLAKTIDAEVRFINIAWAIPYDSAYTTSNYFIFRREQITNRVIGIRIIFILVVIVALGTGWYAYKASK